MLDIKVIQKKEDFKSINLKTFVDFLHTQLGRFRDPVSDIEKSIEYAFSEEKSEGGFVLAAYHEKQLVGGLIMNNTGMSGYIPENILVYIAIKSEFRGKGFGGRIIKKAFQETRGAIKLHVNYDNPAKKLYERLGFENKYADMRFHNNSE